MVAIVWDDIGQKFFETGVDHGVLYTPTDGVYDKGVAWNGLTGVTQSPSGAEANPQYADNIKYANLISAEEFAATIECFTFPTEFLIHDGVGRTTNGMLVGQQGRPVFGFSWRTLKGNDVDPDVGFILNLAYGCQAGPSEKAHTTKSDSPELVTFSFALTSSPVAVTGFSPTALVKVDSTDPDVDPAGLEALLDAIYGRSVTPARLPLPDEVDTILGGGV